MKFRDMENPPLVDHFPGKAMEPRSDLLVYWRVHLRYVLYPPWWQHIQTWNYQTNLFSNIIWSLVISIRFNTWFIKIWLNYGIMHLMYPYVFWFGSSSSESSIPRPVRWTALSLLICFLSTSYEQCSNMFNPPHSMKYSLVNRGSCNELC